MRGWGVAWGVPCKLDLSGQCARQVSGVEFSVASVRAVNDTLRELMTSFLFDTEGQTRRVPRVSGRAHPLQAPFRCSEGKIEGLLRW